MKVRLIALIILLSVLSASGAKNEVSGYVQFGQNTVTGFYGGMTGFYKRNMSSRFDLIGGLNLSTKGNCGFRGVSGDAVYRIPVNRANLFISNRLIYNYYGESSMNEFIYRIALKWETRYIEIIFGNSFLTYFSLGSHVFEPVTWSIGFGANIKPRESPWNVGMFIRNHDDFIYENFNINFGLRGYYDVMNNWRVFCELMVRPAGSMNQLAVKYETAFKTGVKYIW